MFVRVKRSVQSSGTYEYLQVVESIRDGKRVRQRVVANLGRLDRLVNDGVVDGLLKSLARFSKQLQVVQKVREDGLQAHTALSWGPSLVFDRLWREQGLPELLARLAHGRRFQFDIERACFALALQRLCAPGSDLQGAAWLRTVEGHGLADIQLQHLYRAVRFLHDVRQPLETELFLHERDLFSHELDLVFIDTTSTYVYRTEPTDLRRRGYSRDRRGDCPQVVICLAVDRHGWPSAWDVLPGNTADKAAFTTMIQTLRKRFRIGRVVVVADRGMLSARTVSVLEDHADAPFDFILGCRLRHEREVNQNVLARAGRYRKVADNLEVKQVNVDGRRYVVCRNPIEARKDANARAALLESLEAKLANGPKRLIANTGFKRFIKVERGAVSIDAAAVKRDARLDGKFVLRTNTSLEPDEVAKAYKSLWRVERSFREAKNTLEIRPVFHQRDDTTIGHIVGCFLALRLEVDLQRRLHDAAVDAPWLDVMRDLEQVRAVQVTLDGERYQLRTELRGLASDVFKTVGVRPPRVVAHLGTASSVSSSTSDL